MANASGPAHIDGSFPHAFDVGPQIGIGVERYTLLVGAYDVARLDQFGKAIALTPRSMGCTLQQASQHPLLGANRVLRKTVNPA
jgi:hypothetical protein